MFCVTLICICVVLVCVCVSYVKPGMMKVGFAQVGCTAA